MRKVISYLAVGLALEYAFTVVGCSADKPESTEEVGDRGTLRMELQATSASGKVYRLRQATFFVQSFSGSSTFLNTEEDPTRPVIETFLQPDLYQIQLFDGWFIEQVDLLLNASAPVDAFLLTGPFQVVEIQSNVETFVKFEFEVNGERVVFGPPGRLIVGIEVHENQGTGFCGDGIIGAGEQCDSFNLGGETCASATMNARPFGELFCTFFCAFDTSQCFGDGQVDGGGGTAGMGGTAGVGGGFGFDSGVAGSGGADAGGGVPDGSVVTGGAGGTVTGGAGGIVSGGAGGRGGRTQ